MIERKKGRPTKFREEMIRDAELLAGLGFTKESLCVYWGVSMDSVKRWERKCPALCGAIERGRQNANISATQKLYQLVQNGNLSAIIFWLTNRCPELWSDRRAVVNNTITNINQNKVGSNGKFIGEDRELQDRIKRDLSSLFSE